MIIDIDILRKEICKQHAQALAKNEKNPHTAFRSGLKLIIKVEDVAKLHPPAIQIENK